MKRSFTPAIALLSLLLAGCPSINEATTATPANPANPANPVTTAGGLHTVINGNNAKNMLVYGESTVDANSVLLFDPSAAVSGTNPFAADQGKLSNAKTLVQGTLASGTLSGLKETRVFYVKSSGTTREAPGKLFSVSTVAGESNAPVQVSSAADACGLDFRTGVAPDFAAANDSVVVFTQVGVSGQCDSNQKLALTKAGAGASTPPVTLAAGDQFVSVIRNATGAITGTLTVETVGGALQLVKRDANFANPTNLKALIATTNGTSSAAAIRKGFSQTYLSLNGNAGVQLFRLDNATGLLSAALDTVESTFLPSAYDAANLYYSTGARIMRLAHGATVPVQVNATANTAPVQLTGVTKNRVIFNTGTKDSNGSFSATAVVSLLKTDTNAATPTTVLALTGFIDTKIHPDGRVFAGQGTTVSSAMDDGTGTVTHSNAAMPLGGFHALDSYKPEEADLPAPGALFMLKKGTGKVTVVSLNLTTGAEDKTFGDINGDAGTGAAFAEPYGFSGQAELFTNIDALSNNPDSYFLDQTAGAEKVVGVGTSTGDVNFGEYPGSRVRRGFGF